MLGHLPLLVEELCVQLLVAQFRVLDVPIGAASVPPIWWLDDLYQQAAHCEQLLYIRLHPVEVYYLTPAGISTVHNPVDGRSEDLDHFERPLPRSVQKNQLDSVEKQDF